MLGRIKYQPAKLIFIALILLSLIAGSFVVFKIKGRKQVAPIAEKQKIAGSVLPENRNFKKIKFLFFGDIMLDRHVKDQISKIGIDSLMSGLVATNSPLETADVVSANLEGAVTNNGMHYTPAMENDFAFYPDSVATLKKYNFNFFNIANNHITDQGAQGISETEKNLTESGFDFSGCADAVVGDCSIKIIQKENMKIGMAGFSMVYRDFNIEKAENIISELKKKTDLVVVNIHWGREYEHQFNQHQKDVARSLIDAGADMIIGHHPHVVEGMEIYKSKPIFYSLGNFIFDQYFSTDTQEELAVGINFSSSPETKSDIFLFPMRSKLSRPEFMRDEERKIFLEKLAGWSDMDDDYKKQITTGNIIIP